MVLKRKNKVSIVDLLTSAQKFIFAPMAFCALSSAFDFGIIELLDKKSCNLIEIMASLKLDEYVAKTLMDILEINQIVEKKEDNYSLTKMGKLFLYDDMTKANFNFIKDVCYSGSDKLTESFKNKKPEGLYKITKKFPTIYPALTKLPDKMLKSWYEFDHLYSDNSFDEVFKIINKKFNSIYDIGGNTGKFEKVCLKNDPNFDITMLDLASNIKKIKNDKDLKGCKFICADVLDKKPKYPQIKNSAIIMSQFLDCFSKKDVVKILSDLKKVMDDSSSIFILEPYTDMQNFEGAKYSLLHASLYFTTMANGVSKFYEYSEMKDMIGLAGLKIVEQYDNIGSFDYTLLEIKNAMVSD